MVNDIFPTSFGGLTPANTINLLSDNGSSNGLITIQNVLNQFSDDPSNTSNLSAPAIIRGTVYAHLASTAALGQVVVGSGQTTTQRQNNNTILQTAINYAAANGKFFEIIPNIYEIYSTTGLVIPHNTNGTTPSFVWRGSRLGTVIKQMYPTTPGAPILTVGDTSAANVIEGFDIEGALLYYGVDQTGFTSSNALVVAQAAWGKISQVNVHSGGTSNYPYRGVALGNSAGTAGFAFSVTFSQMTCFGAQQDILYINAPGSTGCLFDDIYLNMGGAGNAQPALAGNYVNVAGTIQDLQFNRLNCEWGACNRVIASGNALSLGMTINGLHLEGIKFTGANPSIFDGGGIVCNTVDFQDPTILSANLSGSPSIAYMWPGASSNILINNLNIYWSTAGNINTPLNLLVLNGGLGDVPIVFRVINGMIYDGSGTNQIANVQFDTHMPLASFKSPSMFGDYSYGSGGSKVLKANIPVSATYTHYGQHEDASILVPASITSFAITLSPLMGATGTQLPRIGNTVHIRRQSGSLSGTLTVTNGGGAAGNLTSPPSAGSDRFYVFGTSGTGANNWVDMTPVT